MPKVSVAGVGNSFLDTLLPLIAEKRKQQAQIAEEQRKLASAKDLAAYEQSIKPVDAEEQAKRLVLENILGKLQGGELNPKPVQAQGFSDENVAGQAQQMAAQSVANAGGTGDERQNLINMLQKAGILKSPEMSLGNQIGQGFGMAMQPIFGALGLSSQGSPTQTEQPISSEPSTTQIIGSQKVFDTPYGPMVVSGADSKGNLKIEAYKPEKTTAAETEQEKRRLQTQEGFRRAMGLFTNLADQWSNKIQAQGGEGGLGPGFTGMISEKLRSKGAAPIAAYEGQKNETALSLNNILTGQNRVIRGVVEMIKETLPDRYDSTEFAEQKLRQSISNGFRLFVASQRGMLSEDQLSSLNSGSAAKEFVNSLSLSPIEEQMLSQITDQIISRLRGKNSQESAPQEIQNVLTQLPPGTKFRGFK